MSIFLNDPSVIYYTTIYSIQNYTDYFGEHNSTTTYSKFLDKLCKDINKKYPNSAIAKIICPKINTLRQNTYFYVYLHDLSKYYLHKIKIKVIRNSLHNDVELQLD